MTGREIIRELLEDPKESALFFVLLALFLMLLVVAW